MRIILKGIVDIGGKEAEKRREEEEAENLAAGENEDGDESNIGSGEENDKEKSVPVVPKDGSLAANREKERIYTDTQIQQRRKTLLKALNSFDALMRTEHADNVPARLLIQVAFAINLMLYACKKDHKTHTGKVIHLMDFAPKGPRDNNSDLTFAIRAGRLLQSLWVGMGKQPPLIQRMRVNSCFGISDDFFSLIVISRWAIVRAFIAVANVKNSKLLQDNLANIAVKLYQNTNAQGPIDPAKEEDIIFKLDQSIGFSKKEAEILLMQCRNFIKN